MTHTTTTTTTTTTTEQLPDLRIVSKRTEPMTGGQRWVTGELSLPKHGIIWLDGSQACLVIKNGKITNATFYGRGDLGITFSRAYNARISCIGDGKFETVYEDDGRELK